MAENGEEPSTEHGKDQLPPPGPPRPPTPAGDQIAVHVGEGAAHVAAGKNILQIGSLTIGRWAALLIVAALAAVAVLVGAVAYYNRQTSENTDRAAAILGYTPTPTLTVTPVPTLTPTALPFAPAAEGETLIVILPFHSTAATDSEPHKKIWREIETVLQERPGSAVRAAIDPNVILAADQQAEAERIGKLHNASMIIWGEDTGVELIASFLNLREPDFYAADVDIAETERTQLANPSQYAQFVTRDLPGQMAFLALYAVGQSAYLNNDPATAVDTIEDAIAAANSANGQAGAVRSPVIVQGLAQAYLSLGWLHQQPPADLDATIRAYSKGLELDPQSAAAYNNRGIAYTDQGDFQHAIADYNRAIELDPQDPDAYFNRARANYLQGDIEQALADFNQAIELDPQGAATYNNRGNVYAAIGQIDQALADYNKAIELDPQFVDAYNNRGVLYHDQGDLQQAIADYSKSIELNPQSMSSYNNRGIAYNDQGDFDKAIVDFNKAIELDAQSAPIYYNRAAAYSNQGDLAQAIADYSKAVELDPQDADANNSLCWSLALQQRAQEAMPYCEQAVALDDNASYRDSRGLARALLGDYGAAAADFQTYVDWLTDNYPEETALIERRRAWIEALERGENPFTPQVLTDLRSE